MLAGTVISAFVELDPFQADAHTAPLMSPLLQSTRPLLKGVVLGSEGARAPEEEVHEGVCAPPLMLMPTVAQGA